MQEDFPSKWVPTIALIHQNEYGFRKSSFLIKKYIVQANAVLNLQEEALIVKNTVRALRKRVDAILEECICFDEFHEEYERFKRTVKPSNVTEKLTKRLLMIHVRGQLMFLHQMISHHVRHIHVDISHMLLFPEASRSEAGLSSE